MWRRFLPWMLAALLASGCSLSSQGQQPLQVPVRKGSPLVSIRPLYPGVYRQATVGVTPFRMPPGAVAGLDQQVAALFRDMLLGRQVFPRVRLLTAEGGGGLEEARRLGRQAGVDLVAAGQVDYALAGTELGGARLVVSLRLLNVRTGNTVWHISQAVDQPMDYPRLDFWHRLAESFNPPPVRPSRRAPPLADMLTMVAADMAEVMAGARTVAR